MGRISGHLKGCQLAYGWAALGSGALLWSSYRPTLGKEQLRTTWEPRLWEGQKELTGEGGLSSSVTDTSSFRVCLTIIHLALPTFSFPSQISPLDRLRLWFSSV